MRRFKMDILDLTEQLKEMRLMIEAHREGTGEGNLDLHDLKERMQEMYRIIEKENERLSKDPARNKPLPPIHKEFIGDKFEFIEKVNEIVMENPALMLGVMPPGDYIQNVKDLKNLRLMLEEHAKLTEVIRAEMIEAGERLASYFPKTDETTTGIAE